MLEDIFSPVLAFFKRTVSLITAIVMFVPSLFSQAMIQRDDSIIRQTEHIAALESLYQSGDYQPVNENDFTAFDLQKAYADGVKYNEVSFLATHNSYQTMASAALNSLYDGVSKLTFGLLAKDYGRFTNEFLTDQLDIGIRSFEIDIEVNIKTDGKTQFVCCHSPLIDMGSNCYDLALGLKEIKMWSDHNPGHLPITIIIEPKMTYLPMDNLTPFTLDYAHEFEALLHDTFGNTLMTPAEALGDYASFADMRAADDWPTLEETAGKVLVLLHDTKISNDYIKQDVTIHEQTMFPMVRYNDVNKSYAAFVILNKTKEAIEYSGEVVKDKKCVVRTRVDNITDRQEKTLDAVLNSGAQILSTDFPIKRSMTDNAYFVSFENRRTVNICG